MSLNEKARRSEPVLICGANSESEIDASHQASGKVFAPPDASAVAVWYARPLTRLKPMSEFPMNAPPPPVPDPCWR